MRWALAEGGSGETYFSTEASDAIALSALVLYEVYSGLQRNKSESVAAANLLLAAVQAAACLSTDAVVRGNDAAVREVTNSAAIPGKFFAFQKEGEKDPDWEEIKRSLNVSIEALFELVRLPSHNTEREKFRPRNFVPGDKDWNIDDGELKKNLDRTAKHLGGQFVFFVDHLDRGNLALKPEYKERLKRDFGVCTVVWKQEEESHQVAQLTREVFRLLYSETCSREQASSTPVTTDSLVSRLYATKEHLKTVNETGEQIEKLAETGGKIAGYLAKIFTWFIGN